MPMNRNPDIEGVFHLLPEGGRESPAHSGYRPNHRLYDNYWTSGVHEFPDTEELAPGGTARVLVWLITPAVYPRSLWEGREILVSEGSKVVGTLKVTHVFNPVLLGDAARYNPVWSEPPELQEE